MVLLLLPLLCSTLVRHLVLFRSPSRHTYGFVPDAGREMPMLELRQSLNNAHLQPRDDDPSMCWVSNVASESLAAAARRSILVHSAFSIVATSPSVSEAYSTAAKQVSLPMSCAEVIDLGDRQLRASERQAILSECAPLVATTSSDLAAHDADAMQWVLIREGRGGPVHIGFRLQAGPAGGAGAPGRTPRRSYRGWLGKYALKSRAHVNSVTMEPEIAFMVANMARVGPLAPAVLDPCCGSGGLLLCAAVLGASRLYGVDQRASAFAHASADFLHHDLAVPTFRQGDLLHALGTEEGRAAASTATSHLTGLAQAAPARLVDALSLPYS